jgi:hypothetical protein
MSTDGARGKSIPASFSVFNEMTQPGQYNTGECEGTQLYELIYQTCGCVLYQEALRPQNDTDICTPAHMYACINSAFSNTQVTEPERGNSSKSSSTGTNANAIDEVKRDLVSCLCCSTCPTMMDEIF